MANKNLKQLRKQKEKTPTWLWLTITAIIVIFAIIVGVVIGTGSAPNSEPGEGDNPDANSEAEGYPDGPRNLPLDVLTVGAGGENLSVTDQTVPNKANFNNVKFNPRSDGKTVVKVFFDPQCPACAAFEQTNKKLLEKYMDDEKIVVEYSPVSFLDGQSTTRYSSRATNALGCVVNAEPQKAYDYFGSLFEFQPAEGTEGLSNGQLYELAKNVGVEGENIETCIYSQQFGDWVKAATQRAMSVENAAGTNGGSVDGTPTIFINGKKINVAPNDAATFKQYLDAEISS